MCKTYDAIYELVNYTESDVLICFLDNVKIEGKLYKCDYEMGKEKCYDGIITLKDAKIKCFNSHHDDKEKEFAWINIPSRQIKAFAYKCCEL